MSRKYLHRKIDRASVSILTYIKSGITLLVDVACCATFGLQQTAEKEQRHRRTCSSEDFCAEYVFLATPFRKRLRWFRERGRPTAFFGPFSFSVAGVFLNTADG